MTAVQHRQRRRRPGTGARRQPAFLGATPSSMIGRSSSGGATTSAASMTTSTRNAMICRCRAGRSRPPDAPCRAPACAAPRTSRASATASSASRSSTWALRSAFPPRSAGVLLLESSSGLTTPAAGCHFPPVPVMAASSRACASRSACCWAAGVASDRVPQQRLQLAHRRGGRLQDRAGQVAGRVVQLARGTATWASPSRTASSACTARPVAQISRARA